MAVKQNSQKGIAILTVLPLLLVLTAMLAYVIESDHFAIQKTSFVLTKQHLMGAANGGESMAIDALISDKEKDNESGKATQPGTVTLDAAGFIPDNDSKLEAWARLKQIDEFVDNPGLSHELIITDLDRFYNINNLHFASNSQIDYFSALIQLTSGIEDIEQQEDLIRSVIDWLDADNTSRVERGKRESDAYKGRLVFPANRQISNISELRYVDGMTAEVFARVAPFITAVPIYNALGSGVIAYSTVDLPLQGLETKININTCNAMLVRALLVVASGQLDELSTAVDVILRFQGRITDGSSTSDTELQSFNIGDLLGPEGANINVDNLNALQDVISTRSEYFIAENIVANDDVKLNLLSYIYRNPQLDPDSNNINEQIYVYQRQLAWNRLSNLDNDATSFGGDGLDGSAGVENN